MSRTGPRCRLRTSRRRCSRGAPHPSRRRCWRPFHGGGWVVGDLDTHDNVCRFLANQAGVKVLSVDYRLAPEHKFPAAPDDAHAAFRFAVANAAGLGATTPAGV